MALDVWIGNWNKLGSRRVASFEPEAYYWFMYPMFEELATSHGKSIDLYDGCEFHPDELKLIEELVSKAEEFGRLQPDRFRVHVGTVCEPRERKLYEEINRDAYLEFLATLRSAAQRCLDTGKSLHFYGD